MNFTKCFHSKSFYKSYIYIYFIAFHFLPTPYFRLADCFWKLYAPLFAKNFWSVIIACVYMMYVCGCAHAVAHLCILHIYVGLCMPWHMCVYDVCVWRLCLLQHMYVYDVYVWVCACRGTSEVRGQCCGVGCHPIPLYGSWGLNLDHQGCVQALYWLNHITGPPSFSLWGHTLFQVLGLIRSS